MSPARGIWSTSRAPSAWGVAQEHPTRGKPLPDHRTYKYLWWRIVVRSENHFPEEDQTSGYPKHRQGRKGPSLLSGSPPLLAREQRPHDMELVQPKFRTWDLEAHALARKEVLREAFPTSHRIIQLRPPGNSPMEGVAWYSAIVCHSAHKHK